MSYICAKCKYSTPVYLPGDCKMLYACGYNLKKFTRRPCPAGKGCRVYEERRPGQRNEWL